MGRKKWLRFLPVIAAAVLLVGCNTAADSVAEQGSDKPTITVGCDDYSPFSYTNADGTMAGVDVELAQEAFRRMGYEPKFTFILWEDKKNLLANGDIDCIWSSFTMDGRENEYNWAGPYMQSHQVVAVREDSDIYTLQDLKDKTVAVQSSTKPEDILRSGDDRIPPIRKLISVQKRDLIFLMLDKGYVDAAAAHDTSVERFMVESDMNFRILEEPLQTVGLGVAFDKNDTRGLNRELQTVLEEMQADGTTAQIIGKYLPDAERYLVAENEK